MTARRVGIAILALSVLLRTPPDLCAEAPGRLEGLIAAQDAGDDEAALKALVDLAKSYNDCGEEQLRQDTLFALGAILLDADAFPRSRVVAAEVLGDLTDREDAWYELAGYMPAAYQTETGPFEHAVLVAAAKLDQDDVLEEILEIAEEAAEDRLAAAAVRSLAFLPETAAGRDDVPGTLVDLVATLLPDEKSDDKAKRRWEVVGPPLVATLRKLTGRTKASAKDFAAQGERRERTPGGRGRAPAEPSRPATSAENTPWPELAAGLLDTQPAARLRAVDEIFDRPLVGDDICRTLVEFVENESDWRALSMGLRCLARQDTENEPASRMLKHKRHRVWQVRLALAESLIAYRHLQSVETLVDLLGDRRMRVRDAAAESLFQLTGTDLGPAQKSWAKWLREQRGVIHFIPPEHRPKDAGSTERDRVYASSYNRFFGTRIHSTRVMLVLDKSDSMYYGLWDQVVLEVEMFLRTALPTTYFGVLEFDALPRLWQRQLAPANDQSVDDALGFLQRGRPFGPTNVIDSMRQAMTVRDVDTIVLLSDGVPNRGDPREPLPILDEIRRSNRYPRIAIHTLQMMEGRRFEQGGPRGEDKPPLDEAEKRRREMIRAAAEDTPLGGFLKQMADENDGTFAVVFADWYAPPAGTEFREGTDE